MVELEIFLEYLTEWRSSKQIKEKFNMSNSNFFRMIRWCKKGNYVESQSCGGIEPGKTNRTWLYKIIAEE